MKINSLTNPDIHPLVGTRFLSGLLKSKAMKTAMYVQEDYSGDRHQVREIKSKYFHPESCTGSEIFPVTLGRIFVKISASDSKLVIVPVFNSDEYVISCSSSLNPPGAS